MPRTTTQATVTGQRGVSRFLLWHYIVLAAMLFDAACTLEVSTVRDTLRRDASATDRCKNATGVVARVVFTAVVQLVTLAVVITWAIGILLFWNYSAKTSPLSPLRFWCLLRFQVHDGSVCVG